MSKSNRELFNTKNFEESLKKINEFFTNSKIKKEQEFKLFYHEALTEFAGDFVRPIARINNGISTKLTISLINIEVLAQIEVLKSCEEICTYGALKNRIKYDNLLNPSSLLKLSIFAFENLIEGEKYDLKELQPRIDERVQAIREYQEAEKQNKEIPDSYAALTRFKDILNKEIAEVERKRKFWNPSERESNSVSVSRIQTLQTVFELLAFYNRTKDTYLFDNLFEIFKYTLKASETRFDTAFKSNETVYKNLPKSLSVMKRNDAYGKVKIAESIRNLFKSMYDSLNEQILEIKEINEQL